MSAFGTSLPRMVVAPPGPRSLAMAQRLARVESRNVTYRSHDFPVFWDAARGANVRDVDGNEYVDLTAAFGVAGAGHSPDAIGKVIAAQARTLVHGMGDIHPSELKVALLERLAGLVPWDDALGVLSSSGSEAVETALKTAALATGRAGIVAFEGSYHGLTLGSLATTHRELFRASFTERLYEGVEFVPFPAADGATAEQSLQRLGECMAGGAGKAPIGAVIVEPIQGRAGVRIPPPGFLGALAERTRASGALLIFDEIFTGLGRTGRMFALDHEGVTPDLLCLGKGLGGGLPLSVCIGPVRVMDAWPPSSGEAIHTSTFLGHPLSCAAGIEYLDLLQKDGLVQRSAELGERALARLQRGLGGHAHVRDIRGRGLFVGVELSQRGVERTGGGGALATDLLRRGILILPAGDRGHVLELTPPFTITKDQLDFAVDALVDAVGG